MKVLLLLSVVAAACSQYLGSLPTLQLLQPSVPTLQGQTPVGGLVDLSFGGSDYHFSWRHDGGKKYSWVDANRYCSHLGRGWRGVSLNTVQEDQLISNAIGNDQVKYIWTGGYRNVYEWLWPWGEPFYGLNWSHTGGNGVPQPDNRENGREFCLAVLNNFYGDGIKWHDVACHHKKPIVCERHSGYFPLRG